MSQHLLACQQSLGSTTYFSLIPFFFSPPACSKSVFIKYLGEALQRMILPILYPQCRFTVLLRQIFCHQRKQNWWWGWITAPGAPSDWQSGLDPTWDTELSGKNEATCGTEPVAFARLYREMLLFRMENKNINVLLVSETQLTLSYLLQFSSQWKKKNPAQRNVEFRCAAKWSCQGGSISCSTTHFCSSLP